MDKKKKKKVKTSYSMDKLTAYRRVVLGHHINFDPNKGHMVALKRV
jgi:hypothetical protein